MTVTFSKQSYATKATAKRAAKNAGFDLEHLDFTQNEQERWEFTVKETPKPELSNEDRELIDAYGHAECPECGEHLTNGVLVNGDDNGEQGTIKLEHEFACMACNAEFGKKINRASRVKRERSTVESPCAIVWSLVDEMKGEKRKDIIAAAVAKGVHPGTARVQAQKALKVQRERAAS